MKEKTKRKIFGKWLYTIHRRTRYIRYVKRLKKERKRQREFEVKQEDEQLKSNLKRYKIEEKQNDKKVRRLRKQEEKEELKAMQKAMKANALEEKRQAKQGNKRERIETQAFTTELKDNLKASRQSEREELRELKRKRKQELKERKRRIRRILPYIRKRRRRARIQSIRSIDRQTFLRWIKWFKDLRKSRVQRSNFFKITLNSTFLFILSYLFLYILGQSIITLIAYTYDYNTILFYFKIFYDIDSSEWTGDAVKILYSIQPVVGLVFGVIGLILFNSRRDFTGVFKLFYLWVFVNGMIMFFGSLLIGTLLSQGFGWVISYLYYRDTGKMVFSIISIFALGSLGTAVARSFLLSGNSYFNVINTNNRKFLLLSQVMLPAILGSFAIAVLKFPPEYYYTTSEEVTYEVLKLATFIIIVLPIFLSFSSFTDTYFDEEPRKVRLKFWYILIVLALFASLLFGFGFNEGIEINPPTDIN